MKRYVLPLGALLLAGCVASTDRSEYLQADAVMPFSGPDSQAYAGELWQALGKAGLVGDPANNSAPYKGVHPHGAVLTNNSGELTIDGHTGQVLVKKNYGGEGVSVDKVAADPGQYLKAVTVMFKREAGYDAENQDWFWAKYKADGSLDVNEKGMLLAGRIAKGKTQGCIACHRSAPGGDYIYTN